MCRRCALLVAKAGWSEAAVLAVIRPRMPNTRQMSVLPAPVAPPWMAGGSCGALPLRGMGQALPLRGMGQTLPLGLVARHHMRPNQSRKIPMRQLDPDIRLAALEAVVSRLLMAEARQTPDPAGMLDQFAGRMRREAESHPMASDDPRDRLALAAALLQLVALAKEKLITE